MDIKLFFNLSDKSSRPVFSSDPNPRVHHRLTMASGRQDLAGRRGMSASDTIASALGLPACHLCGSTEGSLSVDTLLESKSHSLSVHYFCLLFSSGLGQSGTENEGIKGFLMPDIKKEIKRGSRLKCVYCRKKGATVGCAEPKCKKR